MQAVLLILGQIYHHCRNKSAIIEKTFKNIVGDCPDISDKMMFFQRLIKFDQTFLQKIPV